MLDALLVRETTRPFDLRTGPLFRALILRLGPEHNVVLLVAHHIVLDGWSFGVLAEDLAVLYAGAEPPPLPDTATSTLRLFKPGNEGIPQMWATHPSNFDREENVKEVVKQGETILRTGTIVSAQHFPG